MAEATPGVATPAAPVTAEVVTPAPETTAVPSGESPAGAEPRAPEPEKMLPQSEVNKLIQKRERIAASRAEKLAMERFRAEAAERELERLRAERTQPSQPKGEPKAEDFEQPADFIRAHVRWEIQQEREREQKMERQRRSQDSAAQFASLVQERFEEAAERYPDLYERLTAPGVAITDPMIDFIVDVDGGFDVGDYLGNNPEESRKIAKLSPARQIVALHEIASKLKAPPTPTKVPAPITPNAASGASKPGYRPDMSDKEYEEMRAKERKAKRGR